MQLRQSMNKLMLHSSADKAEVVVIVDQEIMMVHVALVEDNEMVDSEMVDNEMVGNETVVSDLEVKALNTSKPSRCLLGRSFVVSSLQVTETMVENARVEEASVVAKIIEFNQNLIFFVYPREEVEGF